MLQHDLAPDWLRDSWETAKDSVLDRLTTEEIDEEIAAARKSRRENRLRRA
jgi:hypothetical protein